MPPDERSARSWKDSTQARIALVVLPFVVVAIGLVVLTSHQGHKQAAPIGSAPTQIAAGDTPSAKAIVAAIDKSLKATRVEMRVYDKQVVKGTVTRLLVAHQVVDSPWVRGSLRWVGTIQTALRSPTEQVRMIVRFDGSASPPSYILFKGLQLPPGKIWLKTRKPLSIHESGDPQSPTVSTSPFSSGMYLPQNMLPALKPARAYFKPAPVPNSRANYERYSGIDSVRHIGYRIEIYKETGYVRRVIIIRADQGDQGYTTYVTAVSYANYGKPGRIKAPAAAVVQQGK